MEIQRLTSCILLLIYYWINVVEPIQDYHLQITRQNSGDLFTPEDINRNICHPDICTDLSSGTAKIASNGSFCDCQCNPLLPAFREDLRICVNDIQECVLSPFVGGSSTPQTIPYVFLPLKGQIIHPSREISFAGIETPICVVSGAKFLSDTGWIDLRNPLDTDVPFRLFRDEGRTFLQWVGESDLRDNISGRLVLVYLMCRDLGRTELKTPSAFTLFSPCVAFRIVGSPKKYLNNVNEVAFNSDSVNSTDSMSTSEYVAIGICSLLLSIIYVSSLFFYLNLKKRPFRDSTTLSSKSDNTNKGDPEIGGIIKNNPLITMPIYHMTSDNDSVCSQSSSTVNLSQKNERLLSSNRITSALIHNSQYIPRSFLRSSDTNHQEIEKLPEENVSIVETLEGRDYISDSLKIINGTVRKKLYFNPAYFEPELLLVPPPAALDFLTKIREIITLAKEKICEKKFVPNLMRIPEEDNDDCLGSLYNSSIFQNKTSFKRQNIRKNACCDCGVNESFAKIYDITPVITNDPCNNCNNSNKQKSIRKWLENVPPILYDHNNIEKSRSLSKMKTFKNDENEKNRKDSNSGIPTLKKHMNAVINEFSEITNAPESAESKGFLSAIDFADVPSQPSPSLSVALPINEELTMSNEILQTIVDTSPLENSSAKDQVDYELIVLKKAVTNEDFYKLPQLLQATNGYSLVSEVYVNNGYNYNSSNSSNCSTMEKSPNIRCNEQENSGKLLIEVEDCRDHYIPVHDSDEFEPDTLDRKPSKRKLSSIDNEFIDSLERPKLSLKTFGSFKHDINSPSSNINRNLRKVFGSLREIYEAKTKINKINSQQVKNDDILNGCHHHPFNSIPPDVIPPSPIYDYTSNHHSHSLGTNSKNGHGRSVINRKKQNLSQNGTPVGKLDDLNSDLLTKTTSESDDSFEDDDDDDDEGGSRQSESGAESIETHSVFFNCFRKPNYFIYNGSMDSGLDDVEINEKIIDDPTNDNRSQSDTEAVNYTTVVSLEHLNYR